MEVKNYKISFCVVCMNRLHQLKQTLLKNIKDSEDYSELEFIVLDYNSEDGMEDWAKENLADFISNGRVVYYKTTDPTSWSPSHSKNLAFNLATGDIICSIWADYYTGAGFAKYVNDSFKTDDNIVLTPIDFHKIKKGYNPSGDVLGKVCVKKSDFLRIKGFDERMNRHGFEDYDFINRLEMIGVKRVLIEDYTFLEYIKHKNSERYSLPDDLKCLHVNYKTASESDVLILYRDRRFELATIVDNSTANADDCQYAYITRNHKFEYGLKESKWTTGKWERRSDRTLIFKGSENEFSLQKEKESGKTLLTNMANHAVFHEITSNEVINNVLVFNHFYYTRSIMEKNLQNKNAVPNEHFGEAVVYKNFSKKVTSI